MMIVGVVLSMAQNNAEIDAVTVDSFLISGSHITATKFFADIAIVSERGSTETANLTHNFMSHSVRLPVEERD